MRCQILHESRGRMRIDTLQSYMTLQQAELLEEYLKALGSVDDASVSERTRHAVIRYHGKREEIISALSSFSYDEMNPETVNLHSRKMTADFENRVAMHIGSRIFKRFFLPVNLRAFFTCIRSIPFIYEGIKSLKKGKLEVSLLDAVSISISLFRKDWDTAGDITFLLGFSEILEDYTYRKSVDDLARALSLNVNQVWLVQEGMPDQLTDLHSINAHDHIRVHAGNVIPLDGLVVSGSASVNQASLTGESMPVHKEAGAMVYGGTVIEEGECIVEVLSTSGSGKYDRIVEMIQTSEKMKSSAESRAAELADTLVPYSFLAAAAVYLFSRNIDRTVAVLMVDYSCALKLCIPIAVLSAMRQAGTMQINVKGGKFLEAAAKADTIVFDKTGTLTMSVPKVAGIVTFGGNDETEMLRLAACLEEHFPHSIANAVTKEAENRGLLHEEIHSEVEYVVAHGIVSHIGRKRVLIGSWHFIFEDEKCRIPDGEQERFDEIPAGYSYLYLSIGKRLAAVILIEDPIREEARDVIAKLREAGIEHVVMMTGDSEKTAAAVAEQLGIDEYQSEVLPEDKSSFVKKKKKEGHTIIMVGDGINDAPALAEADVSVAISEGAAIAREVADVTICEDSLHTLLILRNLSTQLSSRLKYDCRTILSVNSLLILSGAFGILQPSVTAYLHNMSTLALSIWSMSDLNLQPLN